MTLRIHLRLQLHFQVLIPIVVDLHNSLWLYHILTTMINGYGPWLCIEEDTKLINPEYVRKAKIDAMNQVEKNKTICLDQECNYIKRKINKYAVPTIQPSNFW